MSIFRKYPSTRLRRLRKNLNLIELVSETNLTSKDLIQPIFIKENFEGKEQIESMPGIFRFGLNHVLSEIEELINAGINAIAVFPVIESSKKDEKGLEALNKSNFIVQSINKIKTTGQLADIVRNAIPKKKSKIDLATKTFQAIRIYLNDEVKELEEGLIAAEKALKPEGRLAVVSFHSIEDKIVKNFFNKCVQNRPSSRHLPEPPKKNPSLEIITKTYLTKRSVVYFHGEVIMPPCICQKINNSKLTTIFLNFHHLLTQLLE